MINPIDFLLPFNRALRVDAVTLNVITNRVEIKLHSRSRQASCPKCQRPSRRIHSYYTRRLSDLPWAHYEVCLRLRVRKFRCQRARCEQKVFCERIALQAISPWARKTDRLLRHQRQIGLLLGGAAGARLSQQLNQPASATTLLRRIRTAPLPEAATPRVLGVDDFAKRKGQHYGTVLMDLERHRPIELLPDRDSDTLATWLRSHPGVEIIARDRAGAYADGARQGAPDAIQVADRFHLVRNLSEALVRLFESHQTALTAIATGSDEDKPSLTITDAAVTSAIEPPAVSAVNSVTVTPAPRSALSLQHQSRDENDYHQAHALYQQGWTLNAMAKRLTRHRSTIRRYLQAATFPEKRRPPSILDPYKPYLLQRWNSGCRTGTVLLGDIRQQGYRGSRSVAFDYITRLRKAQGLPARSRHYQATDPPVTDTQAQTLTARQAAWLVLQRPDKREETDQAQLEQLSQAHDEIQQAIQLSQQFLSMLRQRQPQHFDHWLEQMASCPMTAFRGFAQGIRRDYDAVKAGLSLPWSTGPVEGQINRLKMLKRQMFGRAKLDLLEKRWLYAP